ncbi:uncharacterized protein LOC109715106 isoform X1 [Ananas comosus]|uniref:Uncharacterized protein LOC109715106 isoform X1 n=1 Tax=Ananas comosus TaxID=4615 RepID=A0A6P5FIQ2_ANACO|nr:uncharacterized protein LOC109715106 isoform X1 [Ananas comosus]XP_020095508.1 uncharacterized protein LOC109715106 isoform X1 [Ananas comosus]XP_020095509.1 uncharacterized protein LOC109715106 isoform X1 [Ananas comosus]XP_020095510.1 uncharacterized protein LOC109715106 isoform X1 [Ananas comosus]XP_020095511.1 uncharacterized protein LOC109715106 isoform X1 [Ananas comosus]XP_020095512.1 uncharacterized protein LOC109715106 isoform X1 [Ananas comosus]XP_020095513.1 uncharacterized prot
MALRSRELQRLHHLLFPQAIASIPCLHVRGEGKKPLSSATSGGGGGGGGGGGEEEDEEFARRSAYEVLGVAETSSAAEIKVSFRRLAKETHPDVAAAASSSSDRAAASRRFLRILAAYEILSDSQRRAHYDSYLFSKRRMVQKHPGPSSVIYTSYSSIAIARESNVVEWLKWYRFTIDDIIMQKKVATGSSYFDKLENELYSAIRAAYYGPHIESMDHLPDCFEAEERSVYDTSELLHLVSGRDLFGIVYVADNIPELSHSFHEKLTHSHNGISDFLGQTRMDLGSIDIHEKVGERNDNLHSDIYKDLELHICGRVVAVATRSPKCKCIDVPNMDSEDHIHVYLISNESGLSCSAQSRLLLGTITGLGTSGEEGSCSVYNASGAKTHVIIKHRTLLVKHMHWYQVGREVSACECRSSRARLLPSRYWLFEPRCYMHDIGGWYVETFGRDKKGRTIPSPRQWDEFVECTERRLHPAMYLLALAYRSLDLENAKRRKWSITSFLEPQLYHILHWFRKLF